MCNYKIYTSSQFLQLYLLSIPRVQHCLLDILAVQHFFDPAGEEVVFERNAIADVVSGESDLKFSLPQRPLGVVIDLISHCADPRHFFVDEGQFWAGEGEGV